MVKHYDVEIFVDACRDITIKQRGANSGEDDRVHLSLDQVEGFITSLRSVADSVKPQTVNLDVTR